MTKRQIHLAVFVHGAKGSGKDVTAPAVLLEETYPNQISTLVSAANEGNLMYDGIDICGCRLAQENFVSFASPHLSIHHPYDSLLAKALNFAMKFVYCPLVQQFSFQDDSHDRTPVYKLLADPDYIFIKTLTKFKYRRLYVNATGDGIIPYFSGAIDKRGLFDSFPKMKMIFHPKYPCIIRDFDDINEDKKKFKKGDGGFWAIKERRKELIKKANRDENKKLAEKVEQDDLTWNPLPGRHLVSKKNCMKFHPVQKFMYSNLTQLKFDRALVHLKTDDAHIAIVGIKGTEHYATPLFKHFVSNFQV
ncbi:hypothetical protein K501DRAFT_300165 [Backusella circina FSU 941]|nr:hypothetical protein K501DRAFT_300165 [Backusella circina FSU 941]